MPVRKEIEDKNGPLPQKWGSFMTVAENKADLARLLSQQLILRARSNKTIAVAGGFSDEEQVESSTPDVSIADLEGCHEEADTRIVLHC